MLGILFDKDIKKTYMIPDFDTPEQAGPLFEKLMQFSRSDSHFVYGICLNDTPIGFVNDCEINDSTIELGYVIAPAFQGKGFATEAVRACIDAVAAKQGRKVHLKVILETGLLRRPEAIAEASFLAMEAGADFIKTSTGKVDVNATPAAAYVMCECIAKYYEATGKKIGFKPAGGISSAADALCYYSIVSTILGKEWLNKEFFRFGVSRVANNLLAAVEQKTVSFF